MYSTPSAVYVPRGPAPLQAVASYSSGTSGTASSSMYSIPVSSLSAPSSSYNLNGGANNSTSDTYIPREVLIESPYEHMKYAAVKLNPRYSVSSINLPVNLPTTSTPCFNYDFSLERKCIDNQEKYLTTQLIDKENHESRVKERRANIEAITKASASTPKRVIPTATVASSATNVFNTVSSTVNVAATVNDFVSGVKTGLYAEPRIVAAPWNCKVCTYRNDAAAASCAICLTVKK